jgi:hypothetical protein
MEQFIQSEVRKLLKQYFKTKDPLVMAELNKFISKIDNLLK